MERRHGDAVQRVQSLLMRRMRCAAGASRERTVHYAQQGQAGAALATSSDRHAVNQLSFIDAA